MGRNHKEQRCRKRVDLPRVRIDGVIHNARPPRRRYDGGTGRSIVDDRDFRNQTWCGRGFRHSTLPDTHLTTCMECLSMSEVEVLKMEIESLKVDHSNACHTIAQMHAAAMGEVTGARRGVVEDVEDVRVERDRLRGQVAEMRSALEKAREEIERLKMIALSA